MRKELVLATVFLFCNITAFAGNDKNLTCTINKQYACSSESCKAIKPSVTIKLQIEDSQAIYSRCDNKGCDKYSAQIIQSGIYTFISAIGKSTAIKLDLDEMSFMETNSLLLNAFIAFGKCQSTRENNL